MLILYPFSIDLRWKGVGDTKRQVLAGWQEAALKTDSDQTQLKYNIKVVLIADAYSFREIYRTGDRALPADAGVGYTAGSLAKPGMT